MSDEPWMERLRAATLPGERMLAARIRAAFLTIPNTKKRGAGALLSASPLRAPALCALLTRARISYTILGEGPRHVTIRLHYPRSKP